MIGRLLHCVSAGGQAHIPLNKSGVQLDNLDGKVAVVTGAASGIGLALCEKLAASGMRVLLADIETGSLESAVSYLADKGADVHSIVTDVSDAEQVERLCGRCVRSIWDRRRFVQQRWCHGAGCFGVGNVH